MSTIIRFVLAGMLSGAIVGLWIPLRAQNAPAPQPVQPVQPVLPGDEPKRNPNGTPPAPGDDDMYGPNPILAPENAPPTGDLAAPVDNAPMPADSATVPASHEIATPNGAPPNEAPAQRPQVIPFEQDQAALYNVTAETDREQAEDLPETAEIPTLLAPPEALPALSIIPVVHVDPMSLAFGLRYEALYDNNILLTQNGQQQGDFEHVVAPRVSFRLGDAPPKQYNWLGDAVTKDYNFLALSYEPELLFFQHYGQYNTLDQDLRLTGQYDLAKTTIKESLSYIHNSDPDREIQGRLSRDALANETDAIYQATDRVAFELDGTALIRKFDQEINSDEGRLRLLARYRAGANWSVSFGGAGGILIPDQGANQVYEQVSLGSTLTIGPDLSIYFNVGGDFRQPDNTNSTISTPIFDAEIIYAPTSETRVKLKAVRQIFNDAYFVDQNFISTKVSIEAIQRLWETYQVSAELGYENADYYQFGVGFAGNRADNYPTARVEFNYARYQDLELGVFYEVRKNYSSVRSAAFSDQQAGVQLRVGY